jgi:hypothetical protein
VTATEESWQWQRHLAIAAGGTAALLLCLFVFRGQVFGSSDRLRVYPADGKVTYEGAPLANATLFLHPVGEKGPQFPRPRAVVGENGTFVLGTYRKDDGAAEGEYKVTVQWFGNTGSNGGTPTNLLPGRYSVPKTSDLTVRIAKGENHLPAIQLTR